LSGYKASPTSTCPLIFVSTSGSDINSGSCTAPVKTIGHALSLAGSFTSPTVDVAADTYAEKVTLVSGVTISSGYAADWTQTAATPTKIVASQESVFANGVIGTSLDHLTLAPTTPVGVPGASVYGLRAINNSSLSLSSITIVTPAAATGGAGHTGTAGLSGGSGFDGVNGANPNTLDCSNPPAAGLRGRRRLFGRRQGRSRRLRRQRRRSRRRWERRQLRRSRWLRRRGWACSASQAACLRSASLIRGTSCGVRKFSKNGLIMSIGAGKTIVVDCEAPSSSSVCR
jgi:hypothetical protein